MKWAAFGLAWVATLTVGIVLGATILGEPAIPDPGDDETAHALRRANDDLRSQLAAARERPDRDASPGSNGSAGARAIAEEPGSVRPDPVAEAEGEPVAMDGAFPSLEGIENASQASALLMRFVDQHLARGPDGYRTLLRALAAAEDQMKTLGRFFQDESTAMREIYPWVKFLVNREDRVLDISEFAFKTMAEEPGFFEGMDDDPFEVFTEGVAVMLPGAVSEERLERFRGYARKILEMPQESLPDAIKKNRNDIERALTKYWSKPISTEDALALLKTGGIDATQAMSLLRTLTPEQLQTVDLTGLLMPVIEAGSYDAIRTLKSLPPMPLDTNRLDAAVVRSMEAGRLNGWFVSQYLDATGRDEWVKARPFFDAALASADKVRTVAVDAITRLSGKMRPDADYIRDLLARYELPDHAKTRLKSRYGLK